MLQYNEQFYFVLSPKVVIKINCLNLSQKFLDKIKKKINFFIKKKHFSKNFVELDLYTDNNVGKDLIRRKKIFVNFFSRKDVKLFYNCKNKKFFSIISDNIFSFDTLLRIITSLVVLRNNGVILHSANIIEDKRSVLYVGPTNSGKSTIAKKYNIKKVLTDELSIVIFENNRLVSFKSPFWGELKGCFKRNVINKKYVVDKIMFLSGFVKNNKARIVSLSFKESVKLLLKNLFWVIKDEKYSKKIFEIVLKITKTVPCYKFYPTYEI